MQDVQLVQDAGAAASKESLTRHGEGAGLWWGAVSARIAGVGCGPICNEISSLSVYRMKSKPKPSRPVLPKTEWNFVESKVSNRELPACWLYEYAREHFRNQEDALDTHVVLIGLNVHGLDLNGLALPIVPLFPKLAWQELSKEDRETIVQDIERQREPAIRIWSLRDWEEFLEAHPNQVKINPGMLPPYNFKRWYGLEMSDEAEQGLFAIDWSRSRGEIEADFGRWLDGMQARKASSAKKNPCEIKSALHRWRAETQAAQKKRRRSGGAVFVTS